jgi:arylsulfatase A-like enzyme
MRASDAARETGFALRLRRVRLPDPLVSGLQLEEVEVGFGGQRRRRSLVDDFAAGQFEPALTVDRARRSEQRHDQRAFAAAPRRAHLRWVWRGRAPGLRERWPAEASARARCHAPHHVPKEWADKYKVKFDVGWDAYREQVFAKQKKLGILLRTQTVAARIRRAGLGEAVGRRAAPLRAHDGGSPT